MSLNLLFCIYPSCTVWHSELLSVRLQQKLLADCLLLQVALSRASVLIYDMMVSLKLCLLEGYQSFMKGKQKQISVICFIG